VKERDALLEVERLARETSDEIESFYGRVSELVKKSQDVDDDSIGDLQDFAEQVAGFDGADREPARELRLALVQLDLARSAESFEAKLGKALGEGAEAVVDRMIIEAVTK